MKKKMLVLRSLLIVFILSVSLLGCGKENTEVIDVPEAEAETEDVREEIVPEEQITEAAETVENAESETQPELTVEEWLDSLNSDEVFFTVWNENTLTGEILSYGERYEMKSGDKLYLHSTVSIVKIKGIIDDFLIPEKEINYHISFAMAENFSEETECNITFESEDGQQYNVKNTFVLSNTSEEITFEGGKQWAQELSKDEPRLIVWNDETGMQKELQEGEEYQLQKDDVLAVILPEQYVLYRVSPEDFLESSLLGNGFEIIKYNPIESGEIIELEVILLDPNDQEVTISNVITVQ